MNTTESKGRVLVIDDEKSILLALKRELTRNGYEVTTAGSGDEGVASASVHKYDIAITDLRMPGMDGVETLAALKSIDPAMEVIVVTGHGSIDTAIDCMKKGAFDFIQKPFDLDELHLILERALEKKQLQGLLALYEASQTLLSRLTRTDLTREIVVLSERVLDARAAGLALSVEESEFELFRSSGSSWPSDSLLKALAAKALDFGKPLRLPMSGDPDTELDTADERLASAMAYPLSGREKVLGVLVVLRDTPLPLFSVAEVQAGSVFANQVALSLENAELYGELKSKMEELENIRDRLIHPAIEEHIIRAQSELFKIQHLMGSTDMFSVYDSPHPVEVELGSFLESLHARMKTEIEQKGIVLTSSIDPDVKPCHTDPSALKQVLHHVLGVATDACEGMDAPQISIQVTGTPEGNRIQIKHNGRGMAEEQLKALTGSPALAQSFSGIGRNLVIARKILQKLNGRMEVTSKKNIGTCVDILLG